VFVVGLDENGLGPRLGPLVATAVTLESPSYDRAGLRRAGLRVGIGDSKAVSGFGRMARAESIVLALLERLHGACPTEADELLRLVALDGLLPLRAPCPSRAAPQCWSVGISLPVFGGDPEAGHRALDRLERRRVRVRRACSAIACAGVLNGELRDDVSKLVIDLGLFERLILDARRAAGAEVTAYCGMVGGIRRYDGYFRHFDGTSVRVVGTDRARCAYHVDGLGDVVFEVHADDAHLPVALASMLGKYVRELAMERQNRFYRERDPVLPAPSGYHDPVTARFVERSAPLRRRLGIVSDCFERLR